MNKNNKQLSHLLRARFPFIYIPTYEEERATKFIKSIVTKQDEIKVVRDVLIWTQSSGLKNGPKKMENTTQPMQLIEFIKKYDNDAVFILYDFHVYFGGKHKNMDSSIIRALRDLISALKTSTKRKNVIFISPDINIPETLQKDITRPNNIEKKLQETVGFQSLCVRRY